MSWVSVSIKEDSIPLEQATVSSPVTSATSPMKRSKPIPPPLDLSKARSVHQTFSCFNAHAPRTVIPVIPTDSAYHQKNLPFRKRAFSWSSVEGTSAVQGGDYVCSFVLPRHLPSAVSALSLNSCGVHESGSSCSALLTPVSCGPTATVSSSETPRHFTFPPAPPINPSSLHALVTTTMCTDLPMLSVWNMFLPGTKIYRHSGSVGAGNARDPVTWQAHSWCCVDQLAATDATTVPHGLLVKQVQLNRPMGNCCVAIGGPDSASALPSSFPSPLVSFSVWFQASVGAVPDFVAVCSLQQMFFVQDHGWCSVVSGYCAESPQAGAARLLCEGDVCLVLPPSCCRNESPHSLLPSADSSPLPHELPPPALARVKRPMNGFMLFAKKYRVELISRHPGKDNRAISVMLGEWWRSLAHAERDWYTRQARLNAEHQKRIHPDCWKRKRSHSAS